MKKHSLTFENFKIDQRSLFAHAACVKFADNPLDFKPAILYISDAVGTDKTHLTNAIKNHIKKNLKLKIFKISIKNLLDQFDKSKIKNTYLSQIYSKNYDVVILDDIHLAEENLVFQKELFFVLNDRLNRSKKLVVTSHRPLSDIHKLNHKLVSLFMDGVIADIHMLDIKTLKSILWYKANKQNLSMNKEAILAIAEKSRRSIRQLESNLSKVSSYSKEHGLPVDISLIQKVLYRVA